MSDTFLRARIRKRDKDIRLAISSLNLEEGEMADMIRDGFRMKLAEKGLMPVISKTDARTIARELVSSLKGRS